MTSIMGNDRKIKRKNILYSYVHQYNANIINIYMYIYIYILTHTKKNKQNIFKVRSIKLDTRLKIDNLE